MEVEGVNPGQNFVRGALFAIEDLLAGKTPGGKVHDDPKKLVDRTDERNWRYGGK
jgi:hypothetical protein